MDKKERRKKKSQSNPSAPSQPIILGALRSDQVYVYVCLSVCVWIQNPGRYRYGSLNLDTEGEG